MSHDQAGEQSISSKRKRRSRSRGMAPQQEVLDLTKDSKTGNSSSRKHGRHEQDPRAEGTSKRAKLRMDSEPPTRKDTSTTPRRKRKKSRSPINHHKAPRTSSFHALQQMNKIFKRASTDSNQQLIDARKARDELQKQLSARQEAYLEKVEEVKAKDEDLAVKQKELDNKTDQLATSENESGRLKSELEAANKELALREEKLACTMRELDEVKKLHEEAVQETEALHRVNDKKGFLNEQQAQKHEKAKETQRKERSGYKKKISALQAENDRLDQRHKALQADLKTQENRSNEMITRLQLQVQESRPQSQRFNFKVPDAKVKLDFVGLESKIRQFVDKYARPVLNATDQELQRVWPSWSPELPTFLASPLLCSLVFEGYVWERLLSRIFTPWSEVWSGDLGRSLEKALCIADEETAKQGFESELYPDYQYWRSSSSSFIGRLNGGDFQPQDFESDVEDMVSTMKDLCALRGVTELMETDAMDIFKTARDFEIQLRMLKAVYTFRMCKPVPTREQSSYGVSFDNDSMIDRSPCPNDNKYGQVPTVDFIMCPGLHKRGNNDGDKYEDNMWLVKMGVVCNAARFLSTFRSSTTASGSYTHDHKAPRCSQVSKESEGSTAPSNTCSTTSKNEEGSSMKNPFHIKDEDLDSEQVPDSSSSPVFTSESPAPKSQDAAQIQPSMERQMVTRSHGSPKTDNSIRDGKSSAKPKSNHPHPVGPASGRGGGSSGRETKCDKAVDPDEEYDPESGL